MLVVAGQLAISAPSPTIHTSFVSSSNTDYFKRFHPGLDMRVLSQRIKDLKLAGRSIEEIAREIDPKEFENMWR